MMDVIIPTKDAAEHLETCLVSLKRQTTPVNILIVDAYSKDGTRRIAEQHGATVYNEPPSDTPGSRRAVACNEGLRHSTSRLVGFVDADTEMPPQWAEELSKYFEIHGVAAVTSGCVGQAEGKLGEAIKRLIQFGSTHARNFNEATDIESCPGYNSIYRRKAIDEVGGFNEEIGGCEDWELNKRIRDRGYKILGVPGSPVVHHERKTAKAFSQQMYGYAWSRARLAKVTGPFTPLHATPLPFIVLYPVKKILTNTLDQMSEKMPAKTTLFLAFLLMGTSWAHGYIKGLFD